MRLLRKEIIPAFLVLILLAGLASALWFYSKPAPRYLQGEIEAEESDVSAKISGRVASLNVEEGQQVRRGQVLATLASPEIEAKLRQAKAAEQAAKPGRKWQTGGRGKRRSAKPITPWSGRRRASFAEKTFRRIDRLFADGVVPAQRRDEAETQWLSASSQADAARAAYDMARTGARTEDKQAAGALARQAAGLSPRWGPFSMRRNFGPPGRRGPGGDRARGDGLTGLSDRPSGRPPGCLGHIQYQRGSTGEDPDGGHPCGHRAGPRQPPRLLSGHLHLPIRGLCHLARHIRFRGFRCEDLPDQGASCGADPRAASRDERPFVVGPLRLSGDGRIP